MIGHDHTVLGEVIAAQGVLLRASDPDLVALARLAVHRTSLHLHNDWIPERLPAVWAAVGRFDHAEELAGSVSQFFGAGPLVGLAETAMTMGDRDRASRVLDAIGNSGSRARLCARSAHMALDRADDGDAAAWYAESESPMAQRRDDYDAETLAHVAAVAARLGRTAVAATHCAGIQGRLAHTSEWTTESGDGEPDRSEPSDTTTLSRIDANEASAVAAALGRGGLVDHAWSVTSEIDDPEYREYALFDVARTLAATDPDAPEEFARHTGAVEYLAARLAGVAVVAGRRSERQGVDRPFAEVDAALRRRPDSAEREYVTRASAVALASVRYDERVEAAVAGLLSAGDIGGAVGVVSALARRAETGHATRLIASVEQAARTASTGIDDERPRWWAEVLVDFRDFDRAEHLIRSFPSAGARAESLASLVEGLLADGAVDRAELLLAEITTVGAQRRPRLELIRALLDRDRPDRAVRQARSAPPPLHRAAALTLVAVRTRRLDPLDEALATVQDTTDHDTRMKVVATILFVPRPNSATVRASWSCGRGCGPPPPGDRDERPGR